MDAKLNISLDNAAFEQNPPAELAHILQGLIKRLENGPAHFEGGWSVSLTDVNGNHIGSFEVLTRGAQAGKPEPENIYSLPRVDTIASGYEWTCPECDQNHSEIEHLPWLKCARCGVEFQTNPPEHAYS